MHLYYNFVGSAFFFFLILVLSPQPVGVEALADHLPNRSEMSWLKFQLFYCSDQGCFNTVGTDLVFLVAIRNLLAVFNRIKRFLSLNLHCA